MKVVAVIGTRPEAIKVAPIAIAAASKGLHFEIWSSGQHRDLLPAALSRFGLSMDLDLQIMLPGQSPNQILASIADRLPSHLEGVSNDTMILVQGDTTTAAAAALVAKNMQFRVAHVEAGLRTYDLARPFPEELNRQLITRTADLNFAPTVLAQRNLQNEGVKTESIFVVGNTAIDAAIAMYRGNDGRPTESESAFERTPVLLTLHRRENRGRSATEILSGVKSFAALNPDIEIIYPCHPSMRLAVTAADIFETSGNVSIVEPLDHLSLLQTIAKCGLVITDSGGIQEEASIWSVPTLICRDSTERMEIVESGLAELIGSDSAKLVERAKARIQMDCGTRQMTLPTPFGDGQAAERIVEILESYG
jgi:UDP-N-acetylglucosamine 2-epimerase (non-hydrolysing)